MQELDADYQAENFKQHTYTNIPADIIKNYSLMSGKMYFQQKFGAKNPINTLNWKKKFFALCVHIFLNALY